MTKKPKPFFKAGKTDKNFFAARTPKKKPRSSDPIGETPDVLKAKPIWDYLPDDHPSKQTNAYRFMAKMREIGGWAEKYKEEEERKAALKKKLGSSFFIKASPKPEKKKPAPKPTKIKREAKPKKPRVGMLARVKGALARKPKNAAVAPPPSTSPEKDFEQQKFNRLVQIYEELHQIDRKEFMS